MQIGRYSLEAELGRGGMGVVYRARDPAGRAVALKLLSAAADAGRVLRFVREGELAARLRHPAIVVVHEAFVHEGRPVLVQELVAGPTLDQAWRALPRAARVELVRQVAHGVAHAHARGVVHRDLKAENVVLDEGGAPKVIDFGLATASDLERLTRTGALVGTPTAMAPEQLGDRDAIGPWTDVWALGVLLHEALVDRPPFEATDLAALLAQLAAAEVAPLRRRDPTVSPALEAVCLRCLARAPAARYPDAGALARDLDRVVRGERPDALGPAARPPVLAALGAAAALAVVLALAAAVGSRPAAPPGVAAIASSDAPPAGNEDPLEALRRAAAGGAPGDLLALGAALVDAAAPALRAEGQAWLERAASAGEVEAMVLLGRTLLAAAPEDAASVEVALGWLDRAGRAGRADAWWHAGRHFEAPRAGRTREEVYADAAAARDAAAALRWWGRAAEAGHAPAMRKLGEVHEDGWCVAPDEAEAARWYGRAAEAGDARAMYLLANVLDFFDGPLRDPAKAAAWHARALEALPVQALDDPDAAASLGMHLMGSGARVQAPDPDAAIPWLRRALAGGAPEATVTLGSALLLRPEQQERPGEALALLERGVSMWRGLAALYLGQAFERGAGGLAADRSLAREWFERAIARGRHEARFHLGELLLGDPDPAARQAGLDYLREVAGAADPESGQRPLLAARRLVEALRAGDAQEALRWAAMAARSSPPDLEVARTLVASLAADPATATTLEGLSAEGEAVADHLLALLAEVAAPPRHDEAAARYTRALERGHAPSRWHRALALRRAGRHEAAAPDLRALADEGSPRAMRTLGEALAAGEGLERDDPQAASWLLRAHQAGDRRAAVSLAELVAAGRGVERDDRAALALLDRVRARLVQEVAETHAVLRRAARLAVDLARTLDDPAAVTRWLKVGVSVDEPACMAEWARRLETGDNVAADAEEAARLRARLAELGR